MSEVKLYKGDCLVNLENIKDNSIDLIVTDPPYLIDTVGGQGSVNSILKLDKSLNDLKKNQDITNGYDIETFADIVDRIQGGNINAYFWCNKAQIPDYIRVYVDKLKCKFDILCWHKCLHSSTNIVVKDEKGSIKRIQLKDVYRQRENNLMVYDGKEWTKIIDTSLKSVLYF